MRKLILAAAVLLWQGGLPLHAATLRIVATLPDLASIVRDVGGDRVRVESLSSGRQNPHFVEPKPSLIVKLIKADVFILNGLELEKGWAPPLLQSSRNKKIQLGTGGYWDVSEAIKPLEVPANPDRAQGDVHAGGNPHYFLDPENARLAARFIARKLETMDPDGKKEYQENLKSFENRLDEAVKRWKEKAKAWNGMTFVSYHRVYVYFAERFGLTSAGEIEPKPGIPPTASHTADLIARMKAKETALILTDPWYEKRTPEKIAGAAGAKVVVMAIQPGAVKEAKDYFSMMDYNVEAILRALPKENQ